MQECQILSLQTKLRFQRPCLLRTGNDVIDCKYTAKKLKFNFENKLRLTL